MSTSDELITDGIKSILKEPERDFDSHPLSQEEVQAVIQHLITEVADPKLDEDLAQYYLAVIEFLKTKILYN
jgi:predicted house-cleaning noncanonical NTP pyrophosphatase (MazG superfamily)